MADVLSERDFHKRCGFGPRIGYPVAFAAAICASIFLASVICYRVWLHKQIAVQIAALRAAHLPVTLADLNAWYTAVPNGENAAIYFADNFSYIQLTSNERRMPGMGDGVLPQAAEPLDEKLKAQITKYLETNSDRLQIVHKAMQYLKSRYPIDLEMGVATLLPHLAKIREASHLLQLKLVLALENGNHAEAITAVLDQLRLANTLKNEPIMISQIIRLSLITEVVHSLERTLSIVSLPPAEIDQLSAAVSETENSLIDSWQRSMAGERSMGIDIFRMPTHKALDLFDSENRTPYNEVTLTARRLAGLWDADLLFYLKTTAHLDALASQKYGAAVREAESLHASIQNPNSAYTISRLMLPNFKNGIVKTAAARASLRCCEIALAIEKYRAKTGQEPDTLSQLMPEFLKSVPVDPADDQPLNYTRNSDGYVIASKVPIGSDSVHRADNNNSESAGREVVFAVKRRKH